MNFKKVSRINGSRILRKSELRMISGGGPITVDEIPCFGNGANCPAGYCCGRGQVFHNACVVAAPGSINCL